MSRKYSVVISNGLNFFLFAFAAPVFVAVENHRAVVLKGAH